jgi:putative DNA primase/helicase
MNSNSGKDASNRFIQRVKDGLSDADIQRILFELFPNGVVRGGEFSVGDIHGNPGKSFKFNIRKGVGTDFASNEPIGDIIEVYSRRRNVSAHAAAIEIEQRFLGGSCAPKRGRPPKRVTPTQERWIGGTEPDRRSFEDKALGCPSDVHIYRNEIGEPILVEARFEKSDGRKEFRQHSFSPDGRWIPSIPKELLRPLYDLPALLESDAEKEVLIVEGVKCVNAAKELLGRNGHICTTWPGGCGGADKVDVSPLKGRRIVIWPDNDQPGRVAANKLAQQLLALGCVVRVVAVPPGMPEGWDVADAMHSVSPERIRLMIIDASALSQEDKPSQVGVLKKPVALPARGRPITESAKEIAAILAKHGYFSRDGKLVRFATEQGRTDLFPVSATDLRTQCEYYMTPVHADSVESQIIKRDQAEAMHPEIHRHLPVITFTVRERFVQPSGLVMSPGYNPETQTLCMSQYRLVEVEVPKAVEIIKDVISDFNFGSPVDRSMALAALLMPGLRLGPWMQRWEPFPIVLVQADASQAGKSYFANVLGKLYGLRLGYVAQKKGGLGSLDESLQSELLRDTDLVLIDNLRKNVDSEFLEMVITATAKITARAMRTEGSVDMRSKLLMMTSNGVHLTGDLKNRSIRVVIKKQPPNYLWKNWGGGNTDLLEHLEKNRSKYVGALNAIIQAWVRQGMPVLPVQHSFRKAVGALEWMVVNLFNEASIESSIQDTGSSALPWLKSLGEVASGEARTAGELVNLAITGGIKHPKGLDWTKELMGKLMKEVFGDSDEADAPDYTVTRTLHRKSSGGGGDEKRYEFRRKTDASKGKDHTGYGITP